MITPAVDAKVQFKTGFTTGNLPSTQPAAAWVVDAAVRASIAEQQLRKALEEAEQEMADMLDLFSGSPERAAARVGRYGNELSAATAAYRATIESLNAALEAWPAVTVAPAAPNAG